MSEEKEVCKKYSFVVPGAPRGKGRPRFARRGAFVTTYTDDKTASYENLIALSFRSSYVGHKLIEGPVRLRMMAYFPIPKSMSKKKKEMALNGDLLPTKKPDFDNIAKVVCDSLNQIAWVDDTQVISCYFEKKYSDAPRVFVSIEEI